MHKMSKCVGFFLGGVQSCCFHSTLLLTKGRPSISKKKKSINTINFTLIKPRTKLISTVMNWMNQIAYNQCSSFNFSTWTFSFHTNSKINTFTCKLKRLRIFCNTVLLFATSCLTFFLSPISLIKSVSEVLHRSILYWRRVKRHINPD